MFQSGDVMADDVDEEPLQEPTITDIHGRHVDPLTGRILAEGETSTGSIFAPALNDDDGARTRGPGYYGGFGQQKSFQEMMQSLRAAGFKGENITLLVTPRAEEENAPIEPPPPPVVEDPDALYELSRGNIYQTSCGYCWAVLRGKQRTRGFKLDELQQAASQGCGTCRVLTQTIDHFALMVFKSHDAKQVRIRQEYDKTGLLLSQCSSVNVFFDQYNRERLVIEIYGPPGKHSPLSLHGDRKCGADIGLQLAL